MRRPVAIFVMLAFAGVGCASNARRVDVTMQPTTEPSTPAGRQVRVLVRDGASGALTQSMTGKRCRVQIRRDALGMAGNAPSGIEGRWATESSVEGQVVEFTDQWTVLDATTGRRVVIPHASVLLIEILP